MNEKKYVSNIALAVVLGVFLAVCTLIRTFQPMAVLPKLDIPTVVALSLAALLAEYYLTPNKENTNVWSLIFAAATFGLLPLAAGFAALNEALKLAAVGGAAYFVTAWLFGQMVERIVTGPVAKAAPVVSAAGLYLAAQCFAGMIL